jgi:hypothetical protein
MCLRVIMQVVGTVFVRLSCILREIYRMWVAVAPQCGSNKCRKLNFVCNAKYLLYCLRLLIITNVFKDNSGEEFIVRKVSDGGKFMLRLCCYLKKVLFARTWRDYGIRESANFIDFSSVLRLSEETLLCPFLHTNKRKISYCDLIFFIVKKIYMKVSCVMDLLVR